MSYRKSSTVLAAFVAMGALAAGHPALAQSGSNDPDTISVKVSYADLNLASEDGAKAMQRRLHNAARTICGPAPDLRSDMSRIWDACVQGTTDRAVASFGNPLVSAMNSGKAAPIQYASARP